MVLACCLCAVSALSADAADRLRGVALVIGNSAYEHLKPLANPEQDAHAIEDLLDGLGFDTSISTDRDTKRLSRDLERFAEDAKDADVAILYYSGHGIEAGGENYLVPVDADFSALDAAAEKLVPVSGLIAKLQATVPVSIVMLDACRDSPFPPGTLVRAKPGSDPVPIGAAGLSDTKSVVPLQPPAGKVTDESVGGVVAFAAAPGKAALDGSSGGNSPYAAAVLKHLSSMSGEEFGTVMRMVAEEVYLKTNGRQRPWINESLRRLLYFGKAPQEPTGDEGDILKERRQLLLTIAALPDFDRKQVETTAADRAVPMDALYGMLKAVGAQTPTDPAALDQLLREQADRLKGIMAERDALKDADPEIQRLSGLSDTAIREGALTSAIALNERAKTRLKTLEAGLDQAESNLRQRRVEAADVYARSAQAYALNFDYLKAADDYEQAFGQVERWDEQRAVQYKGGEMLSLTEHGKYKGGNDALERAISVGKDVVDLAGRMKDSNQQAIAQLNLGNAIQALGKRQGDKAQLQEAVTVYRAALGQLTRERAPLDWATTQNNLGVALSNIGGFETGASTLEDAAAAFNAALEVRTRQSAPMDWAMTQVNLSSVLAELGARERGTEHLEQAVAALKAASEELTRERVPLYWAMTQSNLGITLSQLGERESGTARLEEAVRTFNGVLEVRTREATPLDWAKTQLSLGSVLTELGKRQHDTSRFRAAIAALGAALSEYTPERVPIDWATTQVNLGNAFVYFDQELAAGNPGLTDTEQLDQAMAAYRAALQVLSRERAPMDWATAQLDLAAALSSLGERSNDMALVSQSIAAINAALEEVSRERVPLQWADAQSALGRNLSTLGQRSGDIAMLEDSAKVYTLALQEHTHERAPMDWADNQSDLGKTLRALGLALSASGRYRESMAQFQAAATAFQSALTEYSHEKTPAQWAVTQLNLAYVLVVIGGSGGGVQPLQGAVAAYNAALQEYTREKASLDWASAQNNLAAALKYLGQQTGDPARLQDAISAYNAALEVRTRESAPLDWAQTQQSLGNAEIVLGSLFASQGSGYESALLQMNGITAIRNCLLEYTYEKAPENWASAQLDLGIALRTLGTNLANFGNVPGGVAQMQDAVTADKEALRQYTRELVPFKWADTQAEIGYTLTMIAGMTTNPQFARDAIDAYRLALEVYRPDTDLLKWGSTETNLGQALVGLGSITQSRDFILQGRDAIQSVRQAYQSAGYTQYDNYYMGLLNNTDSELARLN